MDKNSHAKKIYSKNYSVIFNTILFGRFYETSLSRVTELAYKMALSVFKILIWIILACSHSMQGKNLPDTKPIKIIWNYIGIYYDAIILLVDMATRHSKRESQPKVKWEKNNALHIYCTHIIFYDRINTITFSRNFKIFVCCYVHLFSILFI